MKRLICWLFISSFALAQGSQQNIAGAPLAFAGVPSGACSVTQTALNTSNGDWYDCPSGSWVKANATGGAVAFSALTTGSNTTAAMTVGSGATLNVASGAVIDFSAIGAGTFKLPQAAAATASATITEILDTSNNNFHFWSNGADSIGVVEASALASNTIPKSTDATHGLITASAITDNGTTVTSSEGLALSGASGAATTLSTTTTNASLILAPNGTGPLVVNVGTSTNPTMQAAGSASNTGLNVTTSNACWSTTGTFNECMLGSGFEIGGNKPLIWGTAAGASGSQALALTPLFTAGATQNTVTLDTTAAANELGMLRAGNACRVTADIALSTSAVNVCSWTLPAVAKAWAWQCQIPWAVTAGTTPTLAIGVNASQTPTAATNASAEIKTTNTNTATEATVALSASGAVNVLTSPTLTTSATFFMSSSSGTLLASATAGTFAVTMTGTGASFAGAAKAGATCWLF